MTIDLGFVLFWSGLILTIPLIFTIAITMVVDAKADSWPIALGLLGLMLTLVTWFSLMFAPSFRDDAAHNAPWDAVDNHIMVTLK